MSYLRPCSLEKKHLLEAFACRSNEQEHWLRHHAQQANSSGVAKVQVVNTAESMEVVAYYAWCMASLTASSVPPRLTKGAGKYPQPVALLARLGVHVDHEGKGLGAALLQDVLLRCASISEVIGCRALLVHAESKAAFDFYKHLLPEFEASPSDPMHLVLLMKDIRKTLR